MRGRLLIPAAGLAVAFLVTMAFLWVRVRWGPPNPEVRQYIEENPEVLSTLPREKPEEARALDDSIAAARQRLLDRAASHLPPAERDEVLALREKLATSGREGMTRAEFRRMLELDNRCLRFLTPAEQQEWQSTMKRLSDRAAGSPDRQPPNSIHPRPSSQ